MKKTLLLAMLAILITPLLTSNYAHAANNWEVRRLKSGICGVAKLKPGIKPGSNRVAGPYLSKAKAHKSLAKLKSTPKCRRF